MRTRLLLLLLSFLLAQPFAAAQEISHGNAARALRQQSLQQRALGDYQGALRSIRQAVEIDGDLNNLRVLLDLQIRLRQPEEARETIGRIADTLPGYPDHLNGFGELHTAGAIAAAWYQLDDRETARKVWEVMDRSAGNKSESSVLLSSYRELRLYDEAAAYVLRKRQELGQGDLWVYEMASMLQSQSRYLEAFAEYTLLLPQSSRHGSLTNRFLRLADESQGDSLLLEEMTARAQRELDLGKPALAGMVNEVLVQHRRYDLALPLVWGLDTDESGDAPFALVHTLEADAEYHRALRLLDRIEETRPGKQPEDQRLLMRARCLEGTGRAEEALLAYEQLAELRGQHRRLALLQAAHLLHRPLGRIREAIEHAQTLVEKNANDLEARLFLVRLLAAEEDYPGAEQLRLESMPIAQRDTEIQIELEFLGMQHAWWQGNLEQARTRLKTLLERQSRHPIFNDTIELMDLLAFSGTDSLAVCRAGEAQRLLWIGEVDAALELLRVASEEAGTAAEWLDWRSCQIALAELEPELALAEMERYRLRHPDSIRLDRLAWMRYKALTRQGLEAAELLPELERLLADWPESILQDRIRREIRMLEEVL